jgi:hypothetical protein
MSWADTLNSSGGQAAIGSVGTALGAIMDGRGARAGYAQQTDQLRQEIAFQRGVMERQAALRAAEVERQQMYARSQGDSFARQLGQFGNVEGDIGAKAGSIGEMFMQALNRAAPESSAPAASGPAADLEAALRSQASQRSADEAGNLAGVQAFGSTLNDKSRVMGRENQLSALLRNFSQGSGGAANSEIDAEAGKFFKQAQVEQQPSMLGDLFVTAATLGSQALADNQAKQQASSKYSLATAPAAPRGLGISPGGGLGLKVR